MDSGMRVYQTGDGTGFVCGEKRYQGFPDLVELPLAVRKQVARWAVAREVATDGQHRLAVMSLDEPIRQEMSEIAEREDDFLDSVAFARIIERLSEEDRIRILRPEAVLDRKLVWPMRPVDVEALFPHISTKQLRDWDVEGLVPAYRWGPGKYRGYFRSQLVLALLVERMLRAGWAIEPLKQAIGLVPEPQREAVEDLQAVVVERRELQLV